MTAEQGVAVVTGGGGGIGGAIAEEMGRAGWFVVTADPLVTLDGTGLAPPPEETTADRIVAAGGTAMASATSVTDRAALDALFADLAQNHGPLDAVVNVAGITRQNGFAHGTADDWRAVLDTHLNGFLNILGAALPHMERQGRGTIVGVTSGSGWRAANAGSYSCAKRAVASLVWQLGRQLPAGVTINALSPIAFTRMVAAAAERARKAGAQGGGGGLSLFDSMPQPQDLAPLATRVASESFRWCSGRVVFAGGSELAMVEEPRLLELVRLDAGVLVGPILAATVPKALASAEARQASEGGGNPRFGSLFVRSDETGPASEPSAIGSCLLVSDRPALSVNIEEALKSRSIVCHVLPVTRGFEAASAALLQAIDAHGPVDAIVLAPESAAASGSALDGWQRTLTDHTGLVAQIEDDAGWARAAADYAAQTDRTIRLLTLIDAVDAGGRSRAQASVQLARSAKEATQGRVVALSVGLEDSERDLRDVVGEVVAYLLADAETPALAGAELALRAGWLGLRSHPRPIGSISFGGPELPVWFDQTMREILGDGLTKKDMTK